MRAPHQQVIIDWHTGESRPAPIAATFEKLLISLQHAMNDACSPTYMYRYSNAQTHETRCCSLDTHRTGLGPDERRISGGGKIPRHTHRCAMASETCRNSSELRRCFESWPLSRFGSKPTAPPPTRVPFASPSQSGRVRLNTIVIIAPVQTGVPHGTLTTVGSSQCTAEPFK